MWPENWAALGVFLAMQSQWSVGMAGPVGMRYEALPLCMELEGVPRSEWPAVMAGLQELERETLRLARVKRRG